MCWSFQSIFFPHRVQGLVREFSFADFILSSWKLLVQGLNTHFKTVYVNMCENRLLQNTALHLATMDNKPNAVALLLSMNCKLMYNCHDMSAIDYAIYYKFPEAALAMVTHEER
jgi:hypothetical protein